jgi:hypothetical protein
VRRGAEKAAKIIKKISPALELQDPASPERSMSRRSFDEDAHLFVPLER